MKRRYDLTTLLLFVGVVQSGPLQAAEPASSAQRAEPVTRLVAATVEAVDTRTLSESDVVAIAAREAPSIVAARYDAVAAQAERTALNRARLPDLLVSARYTRLSSIPARHRTLRIPGADGSPTASFTVPELLDSFSARATVVVPLSEAWLSLAENARALGHLATAKQIEVEAARATVAYEARTAFLIHRRAQVALRISKANLEVLSAQVRDQENRVLAGTAAGSSALTFRAAQDAATAGLRMAEAELSASEATLRGYLPPALSRARFDVERDAPSKVLGGASAGAPALRAAAAAVRAADARADAEQLALLPRLSLVAGAEVSAPHPRAIAASSLEAVPSLDLSLQLDWALSSLTVGSARRDRALAEREALRARREDIRRTLESQRQSATAARASAEARVDAGHRALRTATQLTEARRLELAAGVATPLDVTAAEAERVRAELEGADADLELRLAHARLAYVAGYVPSP